MLRASVITAAGSLYISSVFCLLRELGEVGSSCMMLCQVTASSVTNVEQSEIGYECVIDQQCWRLLTHQNRSQPACRLRRSGPANYNVIIIIICLITIFYLIITSHEQVPPCTQNMAKVNAMHTNTHFEDYDRNQIGYDDQTDLHVRQAMHG